MSPDTLPVPASIVDLKDPVDTDEKLDSFMDDMEKKARQLYEEHEEVSPVLFILFDAGTKMIAMSLGHIFNAESSVPPNDRVSSIITLLRKDLNITALVQVNEAWMSHNPKTAPRDDPNAIDAIIITFETTVKQGLRSIPIIDGKLGDTEHTKQGENHMKLGGRMFDRLVEECDPVN